MVFATTQEIDLMLSLIDLRRDPMGVGDHFIIEILRHTGLRSELCGLSVCDDTQH